jgi:hypothetical protein
MFKRNDTFVGIVGGFEKELHCVCSIKRLLLIVILNIRIHRGITGEMWFGVG